MVFQILHYAFFTKGKLPLPCRAHGVGERSVGTPAENLIGSARVGPDLFDVAFAARSDMVGDFHARGFLKCVDEFEDTDAVSGAEVENLDWRLALVLHEPLH